MKTLLTLALALFVTIVHATELSIVKETIPYASIDEAAKAAITNIFATTSESSNEWAGVIVQIGNQYFYTCPVNSGEFATFNIRVAFPTNGKLVALYHSHPGTEYSGEYFSPSDVQIATELKLPSYIGVETSHNIHRFVPGKDPTSAYTNSISHISQGRIATGNKI